MAARLLRRGPKRIVCVAEGHGEVAALPSLCAKILAYLKINDWVVDDEAVRQPRSRLVDERLKAGSRPANRDGLRRAVQLAVLRPADAVLVVCDSDDDCAAVWGPSASNEVRTLVSGAAVMVEREFEAWLLCSCLNSGTYENRSLARIRDAKGLLKKVLGSYHPTLHQKRLTQQIDVASLRRVSASFDKLVRDVAGLVGATVDK